MGIRFILFIATLSMVKVRLDVPQSGIEIALILYRIEQDTYWEVPAGNCVTDVHGECEIEVKEVIRGRDGFMRGRLEVNEIKRAIIWPGGMLEVKLSLQKQPPHDNRYDFLASEESPIKVESAARFSLPQLLLAILSIIATILAMRASIKQGRG